MKIYKNFSSLFTLYMKFVFKNSFIIKIKYFNNSRMFMRQKETKKHNILEFFLNTMLPQ